MLLIECVQLDVEAYGRIADVPGRLHVVPEVGEYCETVDAGAPVDVEDEEVYTDVPNNRELTLMTDVQYLVTDDFEDDAEEGDDEQEEYDYAWKSHSGHPQLADDRAKPQPPAEVQEDDNDYDEPVRGVERERSTQSKQRSDDSGYINVPFAEKLHENLDKVNAKAAAKAAAAGEGQSASSAGKRKKQGRGNARGAYENTDVAHNTPVVTSSDSSGRPVPVPRQKKPQKPDDTLPPSVRKPQLVNFCNAAKFSVILGNSKVRTCTCTDCAYTSVKVGLLSINVEI